MSLIREEPTLYTTVADRIAGLIDRGTLRAGEKVPSVRKLARQLGISVSTVLQAYRVLEDRGRITAKPQSGYFVRAALAPAPMSSGLGRAARSATRVVIADPVSRMLAASVDPSYVHLGGAIPGDDTLPTRQLNRLSAAIARRSRRGMNAYDLPPGCVELREQVARRYLDAGCDLAPDDLLTTCGAQEALALCLRAITKAGDIVAIESPTFYGHLQLIEALGLRAVEVPSCCDKGVSLDALADALKRHAIKTCLLVTNVQNPQGSVMPDAHKRELVKMLSRRNVPLIEDDTYGDLAFGRARPSVCKAYDTSGSVLLCSSFSKTLAPGARVGWCAPGRYLAQVQRLKISTTLATPTLPQMTIAQFLQTGGYEHHLRKVRAFYAEQVQLVSAAVQRYFPPGTRVTRPAGGFVVWVEMSKAVDSLALYEKALSRKISIAPGPIFSPRGGFKNCVRLNCSMKWSGELDHALRVLGELAGDDKVRGVTRRGDRSSCIYDCHLVTLSFSTTAIMTPPIQIRPATASEVIDLRHAVLRAGLPRETAIFSGDDDPATRHFVATSAGEVVGCVTLFPSTVDGQPAWQLRGMAVTPRLQRGGVGAQLLAAVERFVASEQAPRLLWCNARVPASGFYQRHGWTIVSDVFEIPSAGPHVRMVWNNSSPSTPGEAG